MPEALWPHLDVAGEEADERTADEGLAAHVGEFDPKSALVLPQSIHHRTRSSVTW